MGKMESNNMNNNANEPNKDIHNSHYYEHPNYSCLGRISEYVEEYIPPQHEVYITCASDIPYFVQIPISPELQELDIEDFAPSKRELIFKTKYGTVVLVRDDVWYHQLTLPTQMQNREHSFELRSTAAQLLDSYMLMFYLEERMNGI